MEENKKQDHHDKDINFGHNQRESSENPENHSSSPVNPANIKDEQTREPQTPKQDPLLREELNDTNHNHSYETPGNQRQNDNQPNERNSTEQENRRNNVESRRDSNK